MSLPQRFVYSDQHKSLRGLITRLGFAAIFQVYPKPHKTMVEQFSQSFNKADDIGDAVAKELFADRRPAEGMRWLGQGIENGSRSLVDDSGHCPVPQLQQLLAQAEQPPEWLDEALIEHACLITHRCGNHAMYALGDLGLLGGYANSDISKPLAFTGALNGNSSFDRVSETTSFWYDVTEPGGLKVGAKGYNSALRVRVMHALVRARLSKHPKWDNDEWGLPINQGDSLATNIAFSMIMVFGCSLLGWHFRDKDVRAILHLWRYTAYLMGDDYQQLPETRKEGIEWLYMVAMSNRINPDDDSLELAASYLESFKQVPGPKIYQWYVYWLHRIYAGFFIPYDLKKALRLPTTFGLKWLPLVQFPFIRIASWTANYWPALDRWLRRYGRSGQNYIVTSRLQGREVGFEDKETLTR